MNKLRFGNKIVLGIATAGIVAATAAICVTLPTNSVDPLSYKQEVNAKKYAASSKKQPPVDLFPHNYHSMDFEYQGLYWVDVSRENVHDPVWNGSDFEPWHRDANDLTYDRFTNLFYPRNTVVSIYGNRSSIDGTPYPNEGEFKEQSVLTNWTSQNGFAYLSNLETPFDTQKERDDFKEQYPDKYDATLEEYTKANSFLNFFGGNRDVAQYFFSGIQHYGNNGDGIGSKEKVDGQVINIETAKVTKYSINQFINYLVYSSSTRGSTSLDFGQLYLKDLDRDNSILALLNPQLWEDILLACYENSAVISTIDFSYNNLRVVPNIASIRNKNDTDWFWEDRDGSLGIGQYPSILDYHVGGMNKTCEGNVPIIFGSEPQADGYFDGIDLSHNNLTYFDFNAYNPWDDELDGENWDTSEYGKKQQLINNPDYPGCSRVPSILTLVKCRYDDYRDVYAFQTIFDPSTLKPKDEELIGVSLDYNRLPWFLMNPLRNDEDPNYVWWRPMLMSWHGLKLREITELIGINLPNYVLTCARAYMTYTVANYRSDNIDNVLSMLEYILGIGTYQVDGVNWTDKEAYNYINANADGFGRTLMLKKKAPSITHSEAIQLVDKYFNNFVNIGQLISFPLNRGLVNGAPFDICPIFNTQYYISNGMDGQLLYPIKFDLARIKYLPDSFGISSTASINDIATKIFSTVNINSHSFVELPGFVKDYGSGIGVAVGLSAFALIVIAIIIARVVVNIRHQYEYRRNELGAELSSNDNKKKTKKGKKDKK